MANPNPLEVFRKYQAVMLAVFGVLIVLVFTVGDPLMQMMAGDSATVNNPVIATWVGGDVRRFDVERVRRNREVVQGILARFLQQKLILSGIPQSEWRRYESSLLGSPQNTPDRAVIQYMVMLRKADELGIQVGEEAVNAYLTSLVQSPRDGSELVTRDQMRELIEGTNLTVNGFFSLVADELKVRQLRMRFQMGTGNETPAALYSYYSQLEKQVSAELIGIPVAAFVGKVGEPNDGQVAAFFEEYKDQLPRYDNVGGAILRDPAPGLKQPFRTAVEYVRFAHEDFVDRARDEIEKDEEKIQEFYDNYKDTDANLQIPKGVADESADTAAADAADDSEPASEEPAADADSDEGDSAEPADDAASESSAATDSAATAAAESPAATDEGESANEETEAAEGDSTETDDASSDDADKGDEKKEDEKAKIEYKPLDEVRDYIVRQLSMARAPSLIDETIEPLRQKMKTLQQYGEGGGRDLAKILASAGLSDLEVIRTEELSQYDFYYDTEIGKVDDFNRRVFGSREESALWAPVRLVDYENNNYLLWKISQTEETAPELDEVRDEVVLAWKSGAGVPVNEAADRAQGLALAAAEQMAEKLNGGASVAEVAQQQEGSQVVTTDYFSWYSVPSAEDSAGRTTVSMSSIDGVDSPGPEFMQKAFSLEPGQAGVAFNYPRTMVYVIRLTEARPSGDELREEFLKRFKDRSLPSDLPQLVAFDRDKTFSDWLNDLNDEFDVQFLRE